ncbi:MAG: SDR family oxidoreductase [Planctomycetota bacterium]|nr:MAG: SDR family oxidoreductase [Planctomycetota bacterium]
MTTPTSTLRFQGRVALVTGGTTGIGRATAIAFAREGARVVVAGRRRTEGDETVRLARAVAAAGGDASFVEADVTSEASVAKLVETVMARHGRLDAAFNNAGVEQQKIAPLVESTVEDYEHVFGANVRGVFASMKHEIRAMLEHGGGSIVNNASVAGLVGFAGNAIYSASKHAVVGLTRAAALDYAKSGVRVNAVAPAAIQTPMLERFTQTVPREMLESLHPIGRIGTPEEIAAAVLWLCASESSFVTGQTLAVDGGFTAQ